MTDEAKYKLLKSNFSDVSNAGILLEDREVTLFSDVSSLNVNESGISIEPGIGGNISLNTLNIKQPMSKQSSLPEDFIPPLFNQTPRKRFDLPIMNEMQDIAGLTVILGSFLTK